MILETEAAFASPIGQRFHAAMKQISAAIEHDFLDAGLDRALCNHLANLAGGGLVGALLAARAEFLLQRRCRSEGKPTGVIDNLGRDVLARPENRKARPELSGCSQRLANPGPAVIERCEFRSHV